MKNIWFWLLAVVITLAAAVYQRRTGPTYPVEGKVTIGGGAVRYSLPRSGDSTKDCAFSLEAGPSVTGYLEYKRFKSEDAWTRVPLERRGGELSGTLPRQPAAGKLAYRVALTSDGEEVPLGAKKGEVIRFKDPVPLWILIPHIFVMFGGMLASTLGGLAALDRKRNPVRFGLWAAGLLFLGGFILGPLVQKFAFGVFWSGFPVGRDLTDSKTLFAFLFWVAALVAGRKGKPARPLMVLASVVTLAVYLIPHSLLGSELKVTD
jgi:hypothetical protein